MSEILSESTEKVLKIKRTVTGIKCDGCQRIIPVNKRNDSMYFKVATGHNDWGNDSCESRETQDICPDCISTFATEYLKDATGTARYIEIETCYATPYERWERGCIKNIEEPVTKLSEEQIDGITEMIRDELRNFGNTEGSN